MPIHISRWATSRSRITFHRSVNHSQRWEVRVTIEDELNRRQHSRSVDRCVSLDRWALGFLLASVELRILIWTVIDSISFFFLPRMLMMHQALVAVALEAISARQFYGRLASIVCHCFRKRSRSELHQFSNSEGPPVQRNSSLSLVHGYFVICSTVGS